jgi:tripartite-type tricarboxylate transporter receptor subunit TctC
LGAAFLAFCMGYGTIAAAAEAGYPARPIRLIVPYAAGGSTDLAARQYAELLGRELKQTVVVENKPGASTNLGNRFVSDAEPDGYTLLYGTGQMTLALTFGPFPAIDPTKSLEAVSLILTSPQMLAGNTKLEFSSPEELIAAARKNPKAISVASAQLQMYVNLLNTQANIELLSVPYKGGAPAVTDTIGGRTNLVMAQPPVLLPFIQSGALKPIAMLSKERSKVLPNVKTFAEAGASGMNITSWNGVFAPKGTPAAVIDRLSRASKIALAGPSWASLESQGLEIQWSTPARLTELVAHDVLAWKQLAKTHPEFVQSAQ